jgi:hypothetical protein
MRQRMSNWKFAILFLAGMFALIWLLPMREVKPLQTGKDCLEVMDRVWAKKERPLPSIFEQMDLDDCTKGPP